MWTQADLDSIRAAYALGASKVRYADGREIAYRSLAEMKRVMDDIAAIVGGNAAGITRVVGGYRSGLS